MIEIGPIPQYGTVERPLDRAPGAGGSRERSGTALTVSIGPEPGMLDVIGAQEFVGSLVVDDMHVLDPPEDPAREPLPPARGRDCPRTAWRREAFDYATDVGPAAGGRRRSSPGRRRQRWPAGCFAPTEPIGRSC